MCTRFVYRGEDMITGFDFDADTAVWQHRLFFKDTAFYVGIKVKERYQPIHGVNANGNVSSLLYVTPCEAGEYRRSSQCYRIDLLSERILRGAISFDDAIKIAAEKRVVNVPGCSMQAMLSDRRGRTLLVEPGIGKLLEETSPYSLVTNYSILQPERSLPHIVPGDDRYERAKAILERADARFSVDDAFALLREVRQEGPWATRVSFVYSAKRHTVYYIENNDFEHIRTHRLAEA